jgi:formamidopyrimidine-DNA glycosylase
VPELPEVQTVVSTLAPRLVGRRFLAIRHARPDMIGPLGTDLAQHLRRRTVDSVTRRAKRIVFALDNGCRFYIHLGMTGRLTVEPQAAPVLPHTHLVIALGGRLQLRFRDVRRFGRVCWMGTDAADGDLGPEPLETGAAELAARLARTRRAIKTALLDQRLIAGLGNIYVDESLFAAGIHPQTQANRLSPEQVRRLSRSIKQTLRQAINHRGSTLRDYVDADGNAGGFQRLHRVYGREGEPCRTCKTAIQRIVLGGRSTHFCPSCQPTKPHRPRQRTRVCTISPACTNDHPLASPWRS